MYLNKNLTTSELFYLSLIILFSIEMRIFGASTLFLYFLVLNKNKPISLEKIYAILPTIFIGSLWLLKNLLITGCLFFPVNITCFDNLSWYTNNSALKNAKKIIKETKCDAVKLEGGKKIIKQIKHLIKNKINVMGHLGLLPQTAKGKFKSKGKTIKEKKQLLNDALMLQKCGVFAIVLECVKSATTKQITETLKIPTIGIGSSVYCDGQVLVTDDLIGLNETKIKFVKKFVNIKKYLNLGLRKFASDVRLKKYPKKKHSY